MVGDAQNLERISLDDIPQGVGVLTFMINRSAEILKAEVNRTLRAEPDVNLVGWRVFLGLSRVESATQKELVNFTRTEQAQLSKVLKQMEDRGLVTSRPSESDARAKAFALTDTGYAKHAALLTPMTEFSQAIDGALTDDERLMFVSMCQRIAAAAEHAKSGGDPN